MNKSIQLVRLNDVSHKPYWMTNLNRVWQYLWIWPIVCCLSTNQTYFKMTKWTNRFSRSDQMTDRTNRKKWQTEIGDGNICPFYQLYAVSTQIRHISKWQNEQIDSVGRTKWGIVQTVRNDKLKEWMAMSVHLTKCTPSQYKSEIFKNDKMNKSIQLVGARDGSYKPYEMTN